MSNVYLHFTRHSANLMVGLIATTALLAAAWIGQALAHTTNASPGLWRAIPAHRLAASPVAPPPQTVAILLPPPQAYQSLTPQQAQAANAKVAFSTLPNPPAAPLRLDAADPQDRARARDCLTMAVYYEAANEPDQGQAAVAQVVLNRLRHPLFPKTVCGVVFQGSALPTGCQFTFTCDGSLNRRPSAAGWARAQRVADRALAGYVEKSVGEATHYHTMWVVPYWQPTVVKLTQIGAHIFYRWSGGMGRPVAFQGLYAGLEPAPPKIAGLTTADPVAAPPPAADPGAPKAALVEAAPVVRPAAKAPALAELADMAPPSAPLPAVAPLSKAQTFYGQRAGDQGGRLPVAGAW